MTILDTFSKSFFHGFSTHLSWAVHAHARDVFMGCTDSSWTPDGRPRNNTWHVRDIVVDCSTLSNEMVMGRSGTAHGRS